MLDTDLHLQRPAQPARELDRRSGDGIDVRLLWHPGDDRVTVAVADAKTGEQFELPVGTHDRALDVFHHPYAYAAWRGTARSTRAGALSPRAPAVRHHSDFVPKETSK